MGQALKRSQHDALDALIVHCHTWDGDKVSDELVQNYEKHLAETVQRAAQDLSLRTIRSTQVGNVLVAEIKSVS